MSVQLTTEAIELLLQGFSANVRHIHETWASTSTLPGQTYAVKLENDSALEEHVNALLTAGLIVVDDNEDPMTRDAEPRIFQLTDRAILWCMWMLHRKHLARIELTDAETNLDEFLENIVKGLFS